MNEVHHFKSYLNSRAYSDRTIKDYSYYVERFLKALKVKSHLEVTKEDIRLYHYSLMNHKANEKTLSVVSIRQHLNSLKSFYKYLSDTSKVFINPMQDYIMPICPKTLPRNILDIDDMLILLETPNLNTAIGIRDKAILELMYSAALRNSEVRSILMKDLDLKGNQLWVCGKGNKEAVLPIGFYAKEYIKIYLNKARASLLKGGRGGPRLKQKSDEDYLFVSSNGNKLNGSNLSALFNKYQKKAGLSTKINPHSIRHSCATHLLKNGADIRYIQRLLRHASLDTTQVYTRVEITDLREVQKKYHPREKE